MWNSFNLILEFSQLLLSVRFIDTTPRKETSSQRENPFASMNGARKIIFPQVSQKKLVKNPLKPFFRKLCHLFGPEKNSFFHFENPQKGAGWPR